MLVSNPSILFVDAHDSFSNNIIALLSRTLKVHVRVMSIDDPIFDSPSEPGSQAHYHDDPQAGLPRPPEAAITPKDDALHSELQHYVAVVCGPGPGHPAIERDVGIMRRIWRLSDRFLLPVLGICLGFQSLCCEFGATVVPLKGGQHGIVRTITAAQDAADVCDAEDDMAGFFDGLETMRVVLYQSLQVDFGQVPGRMSKVTGKTPGDQQGFASPASNLIPLAWANSQSMSSRAKTDCGIKDDRVLMAVRHRSKPFWGIQFHPESICSEDGDRLVSNWFTMAQEWNRHHRTRHVLSGCVHARSMERSSLLSQWRSERLSMPSEETHDVPASTPKSSLRWQSLAIPRGISLPDIVEALGHTDEEMIVLDSSNAEQETPRSPHIRGRYSIIARNVKDCACFYHSFQLHADSGYLHFRRRRPRSTRTWAAEATDDTDNYDWTRAVEYPNEIWREMAAFMARRSIHHGNSGSPFWGGFMGYASYDSALPSIGFPVKGDPAKRSMMFVWVTQSIVIDHETRCVHVQVLPSRQHEQEDELFMNTTIAQLKRFFAQPTTRPCDKRQWEAPSGMVISTPDAKQYENKVRQCQVHIQTGDSYELCLTDSTSITIPESPTHTSSSSWSIYTHLRTKQPAPFASYIRLHNLTFMSCSPERFMRSSTDGLCTLRPMKGTVRKSPSIATLAQAESRLQIPKEQAENLMIVDLARHDLAKVCGEAVRVRELMTVEDYGTVWQMSSVVEGRLPGHAARDGSLLEQSDERGIGQLWHGTSTHSTDQAANYVTEGSQAFSIGDRYTGLDVLAASLPPGSMTGAPKKRSCEILRKIEGRERGPYSGVVGYIDVAGRGDWSVNIRCMYSWDELDEIDVTRDEDEVKGIDESLVTTTNINARNRVYPEHSMREAPSTESRYNKPEATGDPHPSPSKPPTSPSQPGKSPTRPPEDQVKSTTSRLETKPEDNGNGNGRARTKTWHIGAGGAVTALSTPSGEQEEMMAKLEGVLRCFGGSL